MNDSVKRYLDKLGFASSEKAFDQATNQIWLRKTGRLKPYRLRWPQLNKALGGGLQPATIYTIGGRPGVGKSSFVNKLLWDVCEENDTSKVIFCYWTWEMPGYHQMIRGISSKTARTVQELMSAEGSLDDELYSHILDMRDHWARHPVYFMSYARSPDYIYMAMEKLQMLDPDMQIVNIFDHTRLGLKPKGTSSEEEKINRLYGIGQQLSVNYRMINIYLSQLNRNIEDPVRKKEPVPMLSDFFGADAVGQFSNVAIMLQRPELYQSIGNYLNEPTNDLLAVHIVKNRDGFVTWIPFDHNLALNQVYERYAITDLPTYHM